MGRNLNVHDQGPKVYSEFNTGNPAPPLPPCKETNVEDSIRRAERLWAGI